MGLDTFNVKANSSSVLAYSKTGQSKDSEKLAGLRPSDLRRPSRTGGFPGFVYSTFFRLTSLSQSNSAKSSMVTSKAYISTPVGLSPKSIAGAGGPSPVQASLSIGRNRGSVYRNLLNLAPFDGSELSGMPPADSSNGTGGVGHPGRPIEGETVFVRRSNTDPAVERENQRHQNRLQTIDDLHNPAIEELRQQIHDIRENIREVRRDIQQMILTAQVDPHGYQMQHHQETLNALEGDLDAVRGDLNNARANRRTDIDAENTRHRNKLRSIRRRAFTGSSSSGST